MNCVITLLHSCSLRQSLRLSSCCAPGRPSFGLVRLLSSLRGPSTAAYPVPIPSASAPNLLSSPSTYSLPTLPCCTFPQSPSKPITAWTGINMMGRRMPHGLQYQSVDFGTPHSHLSFSSGCSVSHEGHVHPVTTSSDVSVGRGLPQTSQQRKLGGLS